MAKATDQFTARDVTFWGVFALVSCSVATLGGAISAQIPDNVLGGLHTSRLDGGNLNQLRGQVVALQAEAAELKQLDSALAARLLLGEQTGKDAVRRVGALEVTVPKILESLSASQGIDRSAITASTGATVPVKHFDADGGSVSVTTTPMASDAPPSAAADTQPMPQVLVQAAPDAGAFGIALGPPFGEQDGAAAWQAMNDRVGTLLLGLTPILGHVEGGPGRRLVVGPIASEGDAQQLCGQMAKVGIACASVPFLGDPMPPTN